MLHALLTGRLILCAVFLVAGLSKLKDRAGSRQSMLDFGVPSALATTFGLLLPLAELALAAGLLPASFAWISAVGALGLLSLFIAAIAANLARGKKPDCHCFGQLHSKPIGWDLVGRNAALAAVAAAIVYAGPRQPGFAAWNHTMGGTVSLLFALAILGLLMFQSWLIFQLVQQGGRVLLRLDAVEKQMGGPAAEAVAAAPAPGLPVGETAPAFALPDLDGDTVSLEALLRPGQPVLLLFTNADCGPCTALLPEVAAWQRDAAEHFRLVMISQGSAEQNRAKTRGQGIDTVLLQGQHEIATQYDALATPSAVLVRPDGTIGSPVASGAEAIRGLVSSTVNEFLAGVVIPLPAGAAAPPLVYPDLEGQMFNLFRLRGVPAILVFWNPGCGYCQQMADDLKTWEKKAHKAGTAVVLISTGTVEQNRKAGFRSRVLLDQSFSAGKAFGVTGTPSAVLLDESGRIASKVAVGKQDILDTVFNAQAVRA